MVLGRYNYHVVTLITGPVPHLQSRPIPRSDSFYSAFSSISIQRIRDSAVLPERRDHFWSTQSQIDSSDHSTRNGRCLDTEKAVGTVLEKGGETEGMGNGEWGVGGEKEKEGMQKL